ncbi:hypothetical protein BJP34_03665 [Moorena producens PAL-8-15-08-1]|uniref:Uncharacterized protein n=1 Tax=Moorena producens PAL-8-15-08-1 TaxID=1458985 RepID=A0A1D8U2M1_9CYAN|nr:hypothetical protein BJP34_03665 [Moorena producens PAL-8-15-08-1]
MGVGNRESGIGNRESGIGNRESGIGNRESGGKCFKFGECGEIWRWGDREIGRWGDGADFE